MTRLTFFIALASGLFAGIMQLSTIFVLGLKMALRQIMGSLFISVMFGFGVAQGAQTWFHLEPFFAGTIGALSGALPAILVPLIVTKRILKQLGMDTADLTVLRNSVNQQEADSK